MRIHATFVLQHLADVIHGSSLTFFIVVCGRVVVFEEDVVLEVVEVVQVVQFRVGPLAQLVDLECAQGS